MERGMSFCLKKKDEGVSPESSESDGELTDLQLEDVIGGITGSRFYQYRAKLINEYNAENK
jgi:hypothetical protein